MKEKKAKKVKYVVLRMFAVWFLILNAAMAFLYYHNSKRLEESGRDTLINDAIVSLNDLKQNSNDEMVRQETEKLMDSLRAGRKESFEQNNEIAFVWVVSDVFLIGLFLYLYLLVLRPFDELEEYAYDMAQGNFNKQLKYHRKNIFGAFTWAFDHMRVAIIVARQNEKAAIENNKTVIATLSHDIKTPIASIRGYAEALSMNMDAKPERRERYLNTILSKCDEVTKITNDMFIHAIHDLDRLELKKEDVELDAVIQKAIRDMAPGQDIRIANEITGATIHNADANRIEQVLENILGNAKKYAPDSQIDVMTEIVDTSENPLVAALHMQCDRAYHLTIRDYGQGVRNEDLPFLFDKFYRGSNAVSEPGTGLGLFIVKYVMEQMEGRVVLENRNGLWVHLFFSMQ